MSRKRKLQMLDFALKKTIVRLAYIISISASTQVWIDNGINTFSIIFLTIGILLLCIEQTRKVKKK